MLKETVIRVPERMVMYINMDDPKEELQRNALILYPYIKNHTMSHGKVAEILGINKWDLIEIYNSLGFPYLSDVDDYREDLETIKCLQGVMK